jgi:dihydroorotate dehydrogenase
LFRLIPDLAVINRMGFNNAGAEACAPRIARARRSRIRAVVGVNIGKTKVVPVDEAIDDYLVSTRRSRATRPRPWSPEPPHSH